MSNLHRSMLKARLPPSGSMGRMASQNPTKLARCKDYKPTMWDEYFAEKLDIVLDSKQTFRIYKSKPPAKPGPILLTLHGGGYSALTWSHFSIEITNMLHCQCLSVDMRGHGDTISDNDEDLSAETLATDIGNLIAKMYPENCPAIHLIGHSMGGAIAVHIADMELIPSLLGVTVIDVVEGTAMEALTSMQSFLRSRPKFFKTIDHAIEWCVRSGQIRNVESAKVSMPGQIVNCVTKKLSTNELPVKDESEDDTTLKFTHPLAIAEDQEEESTSVPKTVNPTEFKVPDPETEDPNKKYTWRIDLSKSEKYWSGWFSGLSNKFLNLRVPKQLLLASIDGLDKALTVGQMQGKFQMQVLSRCGHAVHEDRPHEVAEVIASYLARNKFAEAANDFVRQMPAC